MTAGKPEGDVAREPCPICGYAVPPSRRDLVAEQKYVLESQATRIAELEAALREISRLADGSSIDHIARRVLSAGQGEAK